MQKNIDALISMGIGHFLHLEDQLWVRNLFFRILFEASWQLFQKAAKRLQMDGVTL